MNSANRVTSGGFQYDISGNLTKGTRYGYNAESQLTTLPNSNETYVYDGDGNRIEKLVNGSVTKIYWYGSGSDPLAESDSSENIAAEYIFFELGDRRDVFRYFAGMAPKAPIDLICPRSPYTGRYAALCSWRTGTLPFAALDKIVLLWYIYLISYLRAGPAALPACRRQAL